MDLASLKAEIDTDPLARGYSGMSDQQVAADLNTAYRDLPLASMTPDQLFGQTNSTEFAGLTDAFKQMWVSFCSADRDPFLAANVAFVQHIFGGGSTTVSNLAAARTIANGQSRAQELGLGTVFTDDVTSAKALP